MKKTIFKYRIDIVAKQSMMLPKGAEILCVREQNREPFIWAIVNPDANFYEKEERVFRVIPTGGDVPCDMGVDLKYIGTFIVPDISQSGTFVGHLFEQL